MVVQKNKQRDTDVKVPEKIIRIIFLIIISIVLIIGVSSFFITAYFQEDIESDNEKTFYKNDIIILNILLIPLSLFILYKFNKFSSKFNIKILISIIFIIMLISQVLWVINIRLMPESDQGYTMLCATNLHVSEVIGPLAQPDNYLGAYPFQMGFIKYLNIMLNLFNTDKAILIQLLNVIYSTISLLLIYLITNKLFKNDKVNKICLLLIFGFSLYFVFFNVHVYGNIIGLMFSLLALYTTLSYIDKKRLYKILIIAITITCSIILKSNFNIFLCGILFTLFYELIKNKKIQDIIALVLILIIYLFGKSGFNYYIEKNVNIELSKGVPMISYVYMGMAEPKNLSCGWYTADTLDIYNKCNQDYDGATKLSIDMIKQRLVYFKEHPNYMIKYYTDKLASTWLNPTFQTIWCSKPGIRLIWHPEYNTYFQEKKIIKNMLCGTLYKIEEIYFNIYQIIAFIFAGYGILKIYKNNDTKNILLPITFLGGFVFHIFWETKAIYVIQYYLILIPYTAYGLTEFFNYIKNKDLTKKLVKLGDYINEKCKRTI